MHMKLRMPIQAAVMGRGRRKTGQKEKRQLLENEAATSAAVEREVDAACGEEEGGTEPGPHFRGRMVWRRDRRGEEVSRPPPPGLC